MSLHKYLDIINKLSRDGNIYVENVRHAYTISSYQARLICEMAVIDNLFEKKIGLICPNPKCHDRIIASYNLNEPLPQSVSCTICEAEGEDEYEYDTETLKKIEFYKLRK